MDTTALRIIDANFNRAREGLRVLEEHARFALGDAALTERLKALRHDLASLEQQLAGPAALACRDTAGDVGTAISTDGEGRRSVMQDVIAAASKRLAESLRCIEEYGKLIDAGQAARVESLRYRAYVIEQEVLLTSPRRAKLRNAVVHVLVTESICTGDWFRTCEQALDGGADVIQLREKSLPDGELLARAHRLRELTRLRGALFIVNDRADLARLCGADGVHLGQTDLSVADGRRIGGPTLLVGKSTHSTAELTAAIAEEPDYIAVGSMFASPTKPCVGAAGPGLLEEAAGGTPLPIVAVGGITAQNAKLLACDRALAVAVCQSVIAVGDPARAVRDIRAALAVTHKG